MRFTSALLIFGLNIMNRSNLEKEISTLVTLVSLNDRAIRRVAVRIILPMRMKPTYATLNSALIFNLSSLVS